jgi:tetratricopeptide (TPR) repeat protein
LSKQAGDNNQTIIDMANEVLVKHDSNNLKLMFRRGIAYKNQGKYDEAMQDLEYIYKKDPKNTLAKEEYNKLI